MIRFIFRRLLNGLLVIFGVIIVVFSIFHILPGNPVDLMLGRARSEETRQLIMQEYHLDKSLPMQLLLYFNDLSPVSVHTDTPENERNYRYKVILKIGEQVLVIKTPYLRRSFQTQRRVSEILADDFASTFWLAMSAMCIATVLGVSIGLVAALHQGQNIDHVLIGVSVIGISAPSYISAIVIQLVFGFYLAEWTNLDLQGSLFELTERGRIVHLKHLILPAVTLGIRPLAIIAQMTRSAMIDVLSQDYIRTAKAKGLPPWKIVFKHALKNALNPVLTAVTGWLASLMAGAFFVEYIFKYKGLGFETINAIRMLDLPVVMGTTIIIASFFVVINIFVDILYALIDPRIKLN